MADHNCDVAIVGAGPAGSIAAFYAARRGLNVLLLDKAAFPRVKPCGGGITTKALNRLPFSVAEVLEYATGTVQMGLGYNQQKTFSTPGFICGFAVREKFDDLLLEAAVNEGTEFQKIEKIQHLEFDYDHIELTVDGSKIKPKYLIAADGANSQIRRLVDPRLDFSRGFALEGLVPYDRIGTRPEMTFDFGCVDFGYGWLFPKGDHVNVGIYTCRSDITISKDGLREYCRRKLGTDQIDAVVGFPLGFGGKSYRQTNERVLFVGDAAGMAEPLLGEGIHNAIKSGEFAGKAVADAVRNEQPIGLRYNSAVNEIRRDLDRCDNAAFKFFYPNLNGIGYGSLNFPISKVALMKGFAAGKTLSEIMNGFLFMGFQPPVYPESLKNFVGRRAVAI